MARAVNQRVKNVDTKVEINEVNQVKGATKGNGLKRNRPLVLKRFNNSFVWMGSNDYWSDGRWTRYWEERMKEYDAS